MVDHVGNILGTAQRARLLAMQKTARQLDGTSLRLATGQKVSSALDNPSSFFLSRALKSRAGDISRLLDGIGQSIRVVQEADHGIKAQLEILDLAEAYLEEVENKYLRGDIDITFGPPENETYVTFNSSADLVTYVGGGQDVPASGPITTTEDQVNFQGNFWKRKAFNYTVTANTFLVFDYMSTQPPEISTIGFDNDTNFNNDTRRFFIYGTQTSGVPLAVPYTTYDYTGGGTWQTIEIPVGSYFTGNFSWINFIHDDDIAPFGNASFRNITLREGPVQQGPPISDGSSYERAYAKIVDQLDAIAEDAHYRGINLLKKDRVTTYFNETGSNSLATQGIDGTREGLGLSVEGFDSLEDVCSKLAEIRTARSILRSYGSEIATDLSILQTREIFAQDTINTLRAGAEDLTDADLNEEGATMLALQTRQQIQVASLSIGQGSVLSLFA